ncbi:MAG: SRPBCC family protein, partial [Gemmatimonas sp.]
NDVDVVATRVFDAPRHVIFDAWTKPEHVPHWMTGPEGWTMPVCEIDLRVGGQWHFVWRRANGTEMSMVGTYLEVVPPERLVATESWGADWPETINTVVLTESEGRTLMTMTITYPSKADRERALATGGVSGMELSYARLDAYTRTVG